MKSYKKKYEEIVENLINNSYPELKEYNVKVEEVGNKPYYALAFYKKPGNFIIKISKKVRKWEDYEVKAMLAHELGHFVVYSKVGFILTRISDFFESNIGFWKRIQERKADKIAVRRGYGNYMIKSRQKSKNKDNNDNNNDDNGNGSAKCCDKNPIKKKKPIYLTIEEIKRIQELDN